METKKLLIGAGILVVVVVAIYWGCRSKSAAATGDGKSSAGPKREPFTYDQIALNAKNYTFIPTPNQQQQQAIIQQASRPDFVSMAAPVQQVKNEIDLHNRKPVEMLDVKDLLPESDISGLNFGLDPAEDFANKFVWHRTTHARVKRRNWETGAAMIRGDLIIDPGQQSWFQHTNDYRDLTPGFIPKQYCGELDSEQLSYNMHKVY